MLDIKHSRFLFYLASFMMPIYISKPLIMCTIRENGKNVSEK
jgi:hypothetical protein